MNGRRAVLAGVTATAAMTALWLVEPRIGLARIAVGDILSSLLAVATAYASLPPALGWIFHLCVGILFALLYAGGLVQRLRVSPIARGLTDGVGLFLLSQLAFMPLVGAGVFSRGDPAMLLGSLIGHLTYGGVLGAIYNAPAPAVEAL